MTPEPKASSVPRPGAARPAEEPAKAPARDERLRAEPGTVISGKFRLEKPLGRGAMGSVWAARHLDLDIPVAVKLMLLDIEPDASASGTGAASQQARNSARTRFEREAKAAAQLRSANIVRTLDYGVYLNAPYMVMELLEGEDLAARLKREGSLPASEVARILVPIARALQLAHDAGLVHRDLKPGNIFLAKEGDDEVPKILDFGIARSLKKEVNLTAGETTVDGMLVGTPSYMSPEQATGSDIDHRSDLWALGVVAFIALTGRKPFPGPRALDAVVQICSGPIPKPSDYVQGLPPEIDQFVARALERDREQRFQHAKEMARALAPLMPRSYSSPPPAADGAMRGALGSISGPHSSLDPDSIGTQPGVPDSISASQLSVDPAGRGSTMAAATAPPAPKPKLSISIAATIAACAVAASGIAWFSTRKPTTPEQAVDLQTPSARASSSVSPAAPSASAIDTAVVSASPSASAPPPAVSSASTHPPVRTAPQPVKTTHTAPPPAPAKTGRDLGY